MTANCAEMGRADILKTGFQQVHYNVYCNETSVVFNHQRKVEDIFVDKNLKKNHFTIETA